MSRRPDEVPAVALDEPVSGQESLADTLLRIAHTAASGLGADMAAVSLLTAAGRPTTFAFTGDIAPEIDQAQYDADDGPCLQALRSGRLLRVDDTDVETRWPAFATAARAHGIHSSLSLPLTIDGRGRGALNLYARPKHAFDDISERFGTAFAAQVATAVANGVAYWEKAALAEQLETAMASRAVIEQAKGIIMATSGCSPDEAFNLLREQSQSQNIKLRDIAAELVERQQRRP
jgi:GAF domain-containing protein